MLHARYCSIGTAARPKRSRAQGASNTVEGSSPASQRSRRPRHLTVGLLVLRARSAATEPEKVQKGEFYVAVDKQAIRRGVGHMTCPKAVKIGTMQRPKRKGEVHYELNNLAKQKEQMDTHFFGSQRRGSATSSVRS